jgi:hypothetical protein
VKYSAARLLFNSLPAVSTIEIYVIARFELPDFLSGASDLELFHPSSNRLEISFKVRALRNLHAKFLVRDDTELILGSANLTEGGLYRNQEALIVSRDPNLVRGAQALFWDWWHNAAEVDSSYFSWVAVAGSATKSEVVASLCPIGILADPPNFLPSAIGDPSGCLATLMPSSLGYMLLVPLPPHPVRGLALELRFSVFSALNLCQCCEPD